MKWLLMVVYVGWICHRCHWCWGVERSLVVHLWRMVVHSQAQANMMSIMVCLWRYVIMTTIWICVVCIWLLSLRVFFVLHATVLEPEKLKKDLSWRELASLKFLCHLPYFHLTLGQVQIPRQLPTLLLRHVSVEQKFLLELERLELWIRFALLADGYDLIWPFQGVRWCCRAYTWRSSNCWSCKKCFRLINCQCLMLIDGLAINFYPRMTSEVL